MHRVHDVSRRVSLRRIDQEDSLIWERYVHLFTVADRGRKALALGTSGSDNGYRDVFLQKKRNGKRISLDTTSRVAV